MAWLNDWRACLPPGTVPDSILDWAPGVDSLLSHSHGVTKKCRLSWLTSSAPYMSPNAGGGGLRGGVLGSQPMSTAVHTGAKINFRDLTPYLTYGHSDRVIREVLHTVGRSHTYLN